METVNGVQSSENLVEVCLTADVVFRSGWLWKATFCHALALAISKLSLSICAGACVDDGITRRESRWNQWPHSGGNRDSGGADNIGEWHLTPGNLLGF